MNCGIDHNDNKTSYILLLVMSSVPPCTALPYNTRIQEPVAGWSLVSVVQLAVKSLETGTGTQVAMEFR